MFFYSTEMDARNAAHKTLNSGHVGVEPKREERKKQKYQTLKEQKLKSKWLLFCFVFLFLST